MEKDAWYDSSFLKFTKAHLVVQHVVYLGECFVYTWKESNLLLSDGMLYKYQFSSVQSLSRVPLFVTPYTAACQASMSITNCWSLLKFMSIE